MQERAEPSSNRDEGTRPRREAFGEPAEQRHAE